MSDSASVGELFIRINGTAEGFIDQAKKAIGAMGEMDGAGSKLRVGMLATSSIVAGAATAMLLAIDAAVTRSINKIAELGKTAQQIGVPVEQLSLLDSAAKKAGLSSDELSQAIKLFARNAGEVRSAIEPADAFMRTLESLQVKLHGTGNAVRPTTALIMELADRFSRMPDGVQKSRMAMELFGRTGTEMIPFLNQGPAAIQKWMDAAEKMGPVTKEQADAAQRFNNSLRSINNSFDLVVKRAVLEFLPAMEKTAEKMNDTVKVATNLQLSLSALGYLNPLKVFADRSMAAVEGLPGIFSSTGDKVAESTTRTTNSIKAGIEAWKTTVVGGAGEVGKGVADGFKPMEKTAKQVAEEFAKSREIYLESFLSIRNAAGQFVGGMRPTPEVVTALNRALKAGQIGLGEYDTAMAKAFGIHRQIGVQAMSDVLTNLATTHQQKIDAIVETARKGAISAEEFFRLTDDLRRKKGQEDLEDVINPVGAQKSAEVQRAALKKALDQGIIERHRYGREVAMVEKQNQQNMLDTASVAASALTTMFKDNKAAAIGSAIINTAVGVTKALTLAPPWGQIQAGIIAAAGAAQVAAISSASQSGGGSISAGSVAAAPAAPAQPAQTMFVSGFKANEFYNGEAVRNLAQKFLDFQRDGGQLVLT